MSPFARGKNFGKKRFMFSSLPIVTSSNSSLVIKQKPIPGGIRYNKQLFASCLKLSKNY